MSDHNTIAIIGAGLSGLNCALELEKRGHSCVLYEADTTVGGRIKTKEKQGFLLDQGFEVLLDSYPELERLDLGEEWKAGSFRSGAMLRHNGGWVRLENPLKHADAWLRLPTLPSGFSGDLVRLGSWFLGGKEDGDSSTDHLLHHMGLSEEFINSFLRPFFGGVFLDLSLSAKASRFRKLMGYFFKGEATLPAGGMQRLPEVLCKQLRNSKVRAGCRVVALEAGKLRLESGEECLHEKIVVATEGPQAAQLLDLTVDRKSRGVECYYFSVATEKLKGEDVLYLSGEKGPISNLVFPAAIEPSYAPQGSTLVSATVIDEAWMGQESTIDQVRNQLAEWFPVPMDEWTVVDQVSITHALPDQSTAPPLQQKYSFGQGIYVCGELTDWPSINGALASGRRVAEAVT